MDYQKQALVWNIKQLAGFNMYLKKVENGVRWRTFQLQAQKIKKNHPKKFSYIFPKNKYSHILGQMLT